MSDSVAAALAKQLLAIVEAVDQAAIQASRAQADANTAYAIYHRAADGSDHPKLDLAERAAETAGAKLGKVARLLGEAANALSNYSNVIAPGTAPSRKALPSSIVTGEQLVEDTERRARRAEAAWRKQVQKADDAQDSLSDAEDGAKTMFKHYKQMPGSPGTGSPISTTQPPAQPPADRPQIEHPITAVIMATGAIAVAARAVWTNFKNRKERKKEHGE